MRQDLIRLRDGLGTLAALHTQRENLGADLVGLVVPNATNFCGIANGIPNPGGQPGVAWQVSANTCFAADRHVIAHEFGHLLGGDHNVEDDVDPPYAYSHGRWVNGTARTVMSYDTACSLACPVRLQFSSPNVDFIGFPGIRSGDSTTRDNARSLNNLAPYVAGYRSPVPQARPWVQVAGGTVASDVDAASWAAGRVDVVARSSSGSLLHRALVNGTWTAWQDLGKPGLLGLGSIVGGPTAVSWGANRLDVFVRGNDNHLWHKWWNGNSWSGWQDLGGSLTSDPDVASWAAGRLDVFARGAGNRMFHRAYQSGTWSVWVDLGGGFRSGPGAVSWASGRIDIFARGLDDALWHRWWNGSWSVWESLGGAITADPDVASWGSGRLDVFARGTDNAMYHRAFAAGWYGWEFLGGAFTGGPGTVAWGVNRIDVFGRGGDAFPWHKWWDGASW